LKKEGEANSETSRERLAIPGLSPFWVKWGGPGKRCRNLLDFKSLCRTLSLMGFPRTLITLRCPSPDSTLEARLDTMFFGGLPDSAWTPEETPRFYLRTKGKEWGEGALCSKARCVEKRVRKCTHSVRAFDYGGGDRRPWMKTIGIRVKKQVQGKEALNLGCGRRVETIGVAGAFQ